MICAERVLEARVGRAGIYEVRETELPHIAQALKNFGVDELERQLVDPDVVPQRVAQSFESHARPFRSASRTSVADLFRRVAELLEVLAEHLGQLLRLRVVRRGIGPRACAGREPRSARRRSSSAFARPKIGSVRRLRVVEAAATARRAPSRACTTASCACRRRTRRRSSRCSRATRSTSCSSSSLPSISAYLVGCQTRKTAPKQGAERGLRLGHAALGAGDLRRVAGEEVVHRLLAA